MRRRELIRTLKDIRERPIGSGWFPVRREHIEAGIKSLQVFAELDKLLPEIIEKLEAEKP